MDCSLCDGLWPLQLCWWAAVLVGGCGGVTDGGGPSEGAGGRTGGGTIGGGDAEGLTGAGMGGDTDSGGKATEGEAGAERGEAPCSDVTPCGGDVVGTWNVASSCMAVSGEIDLAYVGLSCESAPVTGSVTMTGTWTANPDGTYADNTTMSGTHRLELPVTCLDHGGTPITCRRITGPLFMLGYASMQCQDNAATGGCTCEAIVDQTGGMGIVSLSPPTGGSYTTVDQVLTAGGIEYSYCVSGTTMTAAPRTAPTTMTGTVLFRKQ